MERPFKLARHPRCPVPVNLSAEWAKELEDLLDAGRVEAAVEHARPHGSPLDWAGAEAMAAGSRLLFQAGAERASFLQVARAFRHHPRHPRVIRAWIWYLWRRRNPLSVWTYLQGIDLADFPAKDAATVWRRRSSSLLEFRDFRQAEEANEQSAAGTGLDAEYLVQKARIRLAEDRLTEALAFAQEAWALDSRDSDAAQVTAFLLQKLARDDELEAFLREVLAWSEERFLHYPLIGLYFEQRRYAEALPWLERVARFTPWAERPLEEWRHSRLADIHYHQGEMEPARTHAQQAGTDFYREFARRLAEPPAPARRIHLPLPFVAQEFHTCGPATLVTLARFWGRQLNQDEVVAEIWYNGTLDWKERRWGERQGFAVREFTVTWEAARRLLAAGFPFALNTMGPGWGHLQAVMGFDDWRNSLLVREPSDRIYHEFEQTTWFHQQAWFGPRGLVLAPPERLPELLALDLPDAGLYDDCFRFLLALEGHRRAEAATIVDGLREQAPDHHLTLGAVRRLADYDENGPARLATVRQLRARFPASQELALVELAALRSEGTPAERIALLQTFTTRRDCHPLLRMELAEELQHDARTLAEARSELGRAHRGLTNARILHAFGKLIWETGDRERAIPCFRFAFTLEPLQENQADSYFKALRLVGRVEEGIGVLRERFVQQKKISGRPALTLAFALELAEQPGGSMAVLEEAIAARPREVELLLAAVEFATRHFQRDKAAAWLQQAGAQGETVAWLRAAARLALAEGRPADALSDWRRVTALAPTNIAAHEEIVALLNRLEGKPAALAHLKDVAGQFPHHVGLQRLFIHWLGAGGSTEIVPELERLLVTHPDDSWLRREFATNLAKAGRLEEAESQAREALAREPHNGASRNVAGFVAACRKDYAAAREHFQTAICLDANNTFALERLLALGATRPEVAADLAFVEAELVRQNFPAEGVREFVNRTWDTDNYERALVLLQAARQDPAGGWRLQATYAETLLRLARIEDAHAAAQVCAERFPLYPGSWLILAQTGAARQDLAGRIVAAEKAVQLNPEGEEAIEALGSAYTVANRLADEAQLYERARARCPHVASFHNRCAEVQARTGHTAEAIAGAQRALNLAPAYAPAWNNLESWGGPKACLEQARVLVQTRPGDAQSWLALARFLERPGKKEELFDALDQACRCDPWNWTTYDVAAQILATHGYHDEALARCAPPVFSTPPIFLRGRAAHILHGQGKRSEAIAALRAILEEDPTYYWATLQLLGWYQEAREFAAETALAEKAVARWPRDRTVRGYLAQGASQCNQRERAIATLKEAVQLDPTYTWGWEALQRLVPAADLEKLALEMTRLCPGHPEPWMMLARAGDAQKRLDKCLAAIDQAIARQARFVAAHEYRADLLARASRYDEALAACSPPAFGDQPPMILQGRAATIRWESGRRDEAIAAMSKLLVAHPNYHWGSVRLLQWLEASKQWDNLLAGARRHQQTFPNDGIGYGFAASALRQQRQLPAAIQELNQAAAKDKGYAFAVEELVRLHLQAGEWTQGLEVLDAYGARVKPGWVAYFRVLLTAGRKDRNAFIAAVEVLAARDDWTHADFPGFKQRLVRAGWLNLFENTLRKQLHARHGSAMAARTCVRLRVERGDWSLRAMERELEAQLRIFQEALSQYLFQVANSRQTYKVLRRVLQKHRMILQSFPQAWGNAAACLVKFDRYADTVAWMTNWRERPDVPLWTLLNLVHALLGLRQFAQAEALAEEVLAKSARQQGTDDLEACVAFLRALGGRPEAAAVNRRAVQNPSAPGYTAFLCVLTDAMLAASGDNPAQRRAGVRQQIRQWRKLLHQVQQYHQLLYAVCSRSALNLLRRQVPGSVRWRDRWAVTALFRRAWLWRVGFYLRT